MDKSLGVLPSLEVLPLFAEDAEEKVASWDSVFQIKEHSSYGEIARNLLTRKLAAGVIPWEIFVADVFSLPGQRNQWTVLLLMNACPTELILRPSVHRAFYPAGANAKSKLPSRLIVGVQNQNSLTKSQFQEWLSQKKGASKIEVIYKMLPMNIRIHALEAEAVDATIAPSPWGLYAEASGIGMCDKQFSPGRYAQQLALVCRKDFFEKREGIAGQLPQIMVCAKGILKKKSGMANAVSKMTRLGKVSLSHDLFEKAAHLHRFNALPSAVAPDARLLANAFSRLGEQEALPPNISSTEQMASLLVSSHLNPHQVT